jgi:hypothetical protein
MPRTARWVRQTPAVAGADLAQRRREPGALEGSVADAGASIVNHHGPGRP